jgi:hypothetical protein
MEIVHQGTYFICNLSLITTMRGANCNGNEASSPIV